MIHINKPLSIVKPYWRRGLISLSLLVAIVLMDLVLPRLIQRIIDKGINTGYMNVVIAATLLMLGISVMQTLFALANNLFSILVGEGIATDLREYSFLNYNHFPSGTSII